MRIPNTKRNEILKELRRKNPNLSYDELSLLAAKKTKTKPVSRQRVHQIIADYRSPSRCKDQLIYKI